jgi:hypothetical protein
MMQVIPEPYVVFYVSNNTAIYYLTKRYLFYKGNNKITELRTILQRESQNS